MKTLTYALIGALALAGTTLVSPTVSAMPVAGLTAALTERSADLQDVRWVWAPGCWRCHRYGYWHRPVYAYWHRPVYWGWHRPFWRRRFWY
jgi:hypothetical protein